jgi:hypothetical protein
MKHQRQKYLDFSVEGESWGSECWRTSEENESWEQNKTYTICAASRVSERAYSLQHARFQVTILKS